jgi:hypothetical protein
MQVVTTHAPPVHDEEAVFGSVHARPQAPQLALSVCGLMQAEPQVIDGAVQGVVTSWHALALHRWPMLHARPQAPQLPMLDVVSTHEPPQLVKPALHEFTHAPEAQTTLPLIGAVHARPQAPQFVMVPVSVQVPLHIA